ncbi:alpha/beta-hydrolase [Choiromyces venosus 120613-1]|uniref:Alpha/beta-hydrolase n=1 Tax=Choiromyces venosus 120613-1 TaxID=1336337 RepID=A0A3N4K7B5_9PEZI|nr:alpha/beta-hydrolase [Choiromyces venosus 120613-1]
MASSIPATPPPPPPQTPHRHSHHPGTNPRQKPQNPRRKSVPSHRNHLSSASTTAASPEVITNLVDSLSKLSPGPLHNPSLYGSLHAADMFPPQPSPRELDYDYTVGIGGIGREVGFLHPDDAALAPVVRTAKPPSGFSIHTNGSGEGASRRGSYTSGISVGKGGVDIPNYVRNYMNRAAGAGDGMADRRNSRESSASGKSQRRDGGGSRLSYMSSRERMRMEKGRSRDRDPSLERDNERELRMSAAGVLSATSGGDYRGNGKAEDAGGRHIPERRSSYGKGSLQKISSYPAAIVTNISPMHVGSPLGSPVYVGSPLGSPMFPSHEEVDEEGGDNAAPAPDLPRNRPERDRKRSSKQFPKRTDSLNNGLGRSPSKAKRKSEPQSMFANQFANQQASPPRPSFQSAPPETTYHERPSSADSIDDAVDSYLCSPRLSQKIRMPTTGRVISFSEVGDPSGFAVFVCVGMGLTRYVTAFYDELALTLGLRLITPDRPGVGESEGIDENERTVLNWPDDVLYICQSLKITKFSILAHSAGAIYALATALRMPGHIRGKIHLLAPWIPPSQMEGVVGTGKEGEEKVGSIPTTQRILRALPTPILKAANSSFMSATSSSLTTSLPRTGGRERSRKNRRAASAAGGDIRKGDSPGKDKPSRGNSDMPSGPLSPTLATNGTGKDGAAVETAEKAPSSEDEVIAAALASAAEKERQMSYDERLTHAIWALSTRNANPAVDLLVCLERNRPVGFRYVDITRAVVIHHGARDTRVPVENVKWLGKTMRRCEVRILEGEGHGLMASAVVMGGVLDEIAAEWRDWRKVVEGREIHGGGRERSD